MRRRIVNSIRDITPIACIVFAVSTAATVLSLFLLVIESEPTGPLVDQVVTGTILLGLGWAFAIVQFGSTRLLAYRISNILRVAALLLLIPYVSTDLRIILIVTTAVLLEICIYPK